MSIPDTKRCSKCGEVKNSNEYYRRFHHGKTRLYSMCIECFKARGALYAARPEVRQKRLERHKVNRESPAYRAESAERSKRFYNSIRGRAKTLLKSAERRSHKYECFDLDEEFIVSKLEGGVCEVTGIPFSYDKPAEGLCKNPYSPSIDRIDNRVGYVKSNVRIVLWQVNLMHGEIDDSEMVTLCVKIIEGLSK